MHVLTLSSRPSEVRRQRLRSLLAGAAVDVLGPGDALPDLGRYDAIVVDGPPVRDPSEVGALATAVERGMPLVAIGAAPRRGDGPWADLLGTGAGEPHPTGEYFAKVSAHPSALTVRVDAEFPIVDRFEPLRPGPASTVLLTVNVGFADHPAVVERTYGAGRVIVSGLGNADTALESRELGAIVSRSVRRVPTDPRQASIGIGVVGYGPYGGMGYYHGLAARSTAGLDFIATCDPSDERRKAAETDFPGVRTYESAEELAGDDEVDVVFVATPPAYHAGLTRMMLEAGKHVACEKPLCLTTGDADQLIALATSVGRVLTVHQNRRWDADFTAIVRAVRTGALGDLFNVETFVGGFEHPCRAWHSDVALSGGAVYDWGSHHIDWILQLLGGRPQVVQTHGHKRVWHDVTNLDQLRVRLTWPDGREAEFVQSDVAAVRRPKFYLQGTAGTLVGHYRPVTFERLEPGRGYVAEIAHHAEAPAELVLARYESGYGVNETRLALPSAPGFAFHRNLADHLQLDEPLAVSPESVREVIAVLEAAQRSSDTGNVPVVLD